MNRLLDGLLDWDKLSKDLQINREEMNFVIEDSYIDKESLTVNIDARLNFVVPHNTHKFLIHKISQCSDEISGVNINYSYDDIVTDDLLTVKMFMPYLSDYVNKEKGFLLKFIRQDEITMEDDKITVKSVGEGTTEKLNKMLVKNIENIFEEKLGIKCNLCFETCKEHSEKIAEAKAALDKKEMKAVKKKADTKVKKKVSEVKSSFGNKKRVIDKPAEGDLLVGGKVNGVPIAIRELSTDEATATVKGTVFDKKHRQIKSGRVLATILITDYRTSACVKLFISEEKWQELDELVKEGDTLLIQGEPQYDTYEYTTVLMAKKINKVETKTRQDVSSDGKRVELHVHTKMSDNDGFNDVKKLIKTAAKWGHPAVAITDHGVVQSFPDAANIREELIKEGIDIKVIYGLEGYLYDDSDSIDSEGNIDYKKHGTNHIILLAKNQKGLKNLYKLVSYSHLKYFYKKPRIPKSVLNQHREGLIIGSACEAGEVFAAIKNNKSDEEILEIASFYDYLEIQPLINNSFMIKNKTISSEDELKAFNLKVLETADKLGKLTVATTDSHYFDEDSAIYRNIIMSGIGFKDANGSGLYFRTTDEMLKEFTYLGEARAREVVIDNTNKIADMIDVVEPIANNKFPPKIEGAEEILRTTCLNKAHEIYGNPLPESIKERFDTELNSIIDNGYAVMYVSAQMLVKKSLEDGYLVGSRGSVGSSFAATMAGITEVNPLDPHYICPKCKNLEWGDLNEYDCGVDMPDKNCPKCGTKYIKDGYNIPFATFLGFSGDKEPDIDLNFAGEYQARAHKYVGEIFGERNVFKAGTVATIADRTAYGYVTHYIEDNNYDVNKYEIDRLTKGCTGVKRTTGQHPGGIIIVPDDKEIYEFCPVQHPANATDTDIVTTHFDYHKIEKNLLKLDILGHDIPSMIRRLQDMTDIDPLSIDLSDKKVMSIFTSLDALEIKNDNYEFTHGSYAIPEFGTSFVRKMLDDTKPTTMSALIRISGFSHGTNVWLNNAQEFITNGTATMKEAISTRDDIMNYLILKGIDKSESFKIMEIVRKHKKPLSEEQLAVMKEHGVPEWYIESCKRIEYMFPRAHAVAYVMMSFRMAWFKVYYPKEFYATYFTTKIDSFNAEVILGGIDSVQERMEEVKKMGTNASKKDLDEVLIFEVAYEMYSRGYDFLPPKLGHSEAVAFIIDEGKVRLPYAAVSGVGYTAAESVAIEYKTTEFKTLEDVKLRTKLSSTNIEELKKYGVFDGVPDSAQISIFDM